jgi:hypothetical protein
MEIELAALYTVTVEAIWLRGTPYCFAGCWKNIHVVSMNCDNSTIIVKVNRSKDNMKTTRHVKRRLKSVRKLRNSGVIASDFVHTSKNITYQFTKRTITQCDRQCIEWDGLETRMKSIEVVSYILRDRSSREVGWWNKAIGRLGEETLTWFISFMMHFSSSLYGRLVYTLMWSEWLIQVEMSAYRTSSKEHTYVSLIY